MSLYSLGSRYWDSISPYWFEEKFRLNDELDRGVIVIGAPVYIIILVTAIVNDSYVLLLLGLSNILLKQMFPIPFSGKSIFRISITWLVWK